MGAERDLSRRHPARDCLLWTHRGARLFARHFLEYNSARRSRLRRDTRRLRQDVKLKSLRFCFRLFLLLLTTVCVPTARWLIESSERARDLDSIMPPTSTPPRRLTKETSLRPPHPNPSHLLSARHNRLVFFPPADPLCVAALQKKKEKKKEEASSTFLT